MRTDDVLIADTRKWLIDTGWRCDTCHKWIPGTYGNLRVSRGPVVAGKSPWLDFGLVHKNRECDPHATHRSPWSIFHLEGPDGANRLLGVLTPGPAIDTTERYTVDLDSWTDVFRRLYVPGYENARHRLTHPRTRAEYDGYSNDLPYQQEELERIRTQYFGGTSDYLTLVEGRAARYPSGNVPQ